MIAAEMIASMGYEGGSGYTSGDPAKTAWADWAAAYVKYCDGGSMTGTREDPTPQRNGSTGPLWYRGKYNLDAQLDLLTVGRVRRLRLAALLGRPAVALRERAAQPVHLELQPSIRVCIRHGLADGVGLPVGDHVEVRDRARELPLRSEKLGVRHREIR